MDAAHDTPGSGPNYTHNPSDILLIMPRDAQLIDIQLSETGQSSSYTGARQPYVTNEGLVNMNAVSYGKEAELVLTSIPLLETTEEDGSVTSLLLYSSKYIGVDIGNGLVDQLFLVERSKGPDGKMRLASTPATLYTAESKVAGWYTDNSQTANAVMRSLGGAKGLIEFLGARASGEDVTPQETALKTELQKRNTERIALRPQDVERALEHRKRARDITEYKGYLKSDNAGTISYSGLKDWLGRKRKY